MPKKLTLAQKKLVFNRLFKTARWALRRHYKPDEASQIMRAFKDDRVEIVVIAARDLFNAIKREEDALRYVQV